MKSIHLSKKITYFLLSLSFILVSCAKNRSIDSVEEPNSSPSSPILPRFTASNIELGQQIPSYYVGFNGRSTEGPSWTNTQFLEMIAWMNPMCVRYPAGTQANYWDWRNGGFINSEPKYPFYIKDFVKGLSQQSQIIYVINMARPTPITGYTGNESVEILTSEAVLNAKISDILAAIEEFKSCGNLPIAIEFGNEFYFNNEHAGIYASNPSLYLDHVKIIGQRIKSLYPNIHLLVCTTKGGSKGRDTWNAAVYDRFEEDQSFNQLIRGVVQHHYINSSFGDQNPITTLDGVENAIQEGLNYAKSVQEDYNGVPDHKKLWITEYGITKKPDEAGMWGVGLQYLAMSLSWIDLGDKIENMCCQHITLDPGVIDRETIRMGPVGVVLGALSNALSGKTSLRKVVFSARDKTDEEKAASLYGWSFFDQDAVTVLILNTNREKKNDIDLTNLFSKSDCRVSIEEYFSENPVQNPVYKSEGIQIISTSKESSESLNIRPFSITVVRGKR